MRLVGVLLACVACTDTVLLEDDPLAELVALEVVPADATLTITDLAAPPGLELVATGTFRDGSRRDVTELVAWTVDHAAPGRFDTAGHYLASCGAAGRVVVRATGSGHEALSTLAVVVDVTIIDPDAPPTQPAQAATTFDAARSPQLLYPASSTRFPQGLESVELQLATGKGNDSFRLAFDSELFHLTVLTAADRWRPVPAIWSLIAASHLGGDVALTISGASSQSPSTSFAADPIAFGFSRATVPGTLTYWTDGTNNILQSSLAGAPTPIYPTAGDGTCVGCHVVSRDGTQLAFGYDGEQLRTVDVDALAPIVDNKAPMGWATFSPDGGRLLVADKGTLTLLDAKTGVPIGPDGGVVPLPPGLKATHPDWSPDGQYVAVALAHAILANTDVNRAEIARIPFTNGVWGVPEVLVPLTGPRDNNYFPRYSPDGSHIAYVHATGTSRRAADAELRLIRMDGGTPIPLQMASHRVGREDEADLANTMPWWAPASGDVAWLAFASSRAYGSIRGTGPSQIWIAAIDLADPTDPSYPAFWLPGQDLQTMHLNPIWIPEHPID